MIKSRPVQRWWHLLLLISAALVLSGCMSSAKSVPSRYSLTFDADPQINSVTGQPPAPIKVRVLLLRSDSEFMETDFFTLQNDAKSVLGNSLLDSDQFFLTQGKRAKRWLEKVRWRPVISALLPNTRSWTAKHGASRYPYLSPPKPTSTRYGNYLLKN